MTQSNTSLRDRQAAWHRHWIDLARADQEYGGAGFEQSLSVARMAVDHFGGAPLRKVLDETGLGSHPEVVRTFWRIGKALAAGRALGSQAASKPMDPPKKSLKELFYPNSNMRS